jgi:hypothetical protein
MGGFMTPVYSFGYLKNMGRLINPVHPVPCCLRLRRPVILFRIILKWIFRKNGRTWTGFIWVSIGTGDGLLLTW